MLDLKLIRENPAKIKAGIALKRVVVDLEGLLQLDTSRRALVFQVDELKAKKNTANDNISRLIKDKQDPKPTIASMKAIAAEIDALEPKVKLIDEQIQNILLMIPNIPHGSVPQGGMEANQVLSNWGDKPVFDFKPKTHVEIAESLDIIDFKRGTKLSGSNFILYKDQGARLERALYNFMLDLHTSQHGYREMSPPVLVNTASMTATGQLPKMKEDMYRLESDGDLYLIPTAEVPVTNIHRDEMLNEEDLPLYYTAYTTCFRREAGSYGKDTRGLVRIHQFDKVELVKFVKPENSYQELETLLGNAARVFELLKIPYRVLLLASGDLSFAAAKCCDIEVYAAGMDKWLEASSCSNFEDFQARRGNISYKGKDGKKKGFVHTLNGSGVALPRTMVAILENYQTSQGDVLVPEVLRPYMGGLSESPAAKPRLPAPQNAVVVNDKRRDPIGEYCVKEVFFSILKLVAFLLILPLIIASFIAFQTQILLLPVNKEAWVLWGAGSYVGLNLFVYDFKNFYIFGKTLVEKMFPFFKAAGYVIPIFSILLIIVYVIILILGRGTPIQPYMLFAIAFTLTMHLVLTAHDIYDADKSILKAHYLCAFGAVLVASFLIMSLLLTWAIPEYSFVGFIKILTAKTFHLYKSVYRALFVDS